jgi:hypothetical protein
LWEVFLSRVDVSFYYNTVLRALLTLAIGSDAPLSFPPILVTTLIIDMIRY